MLLGNQAKTTTVLWLFILGHSLLLAQENNTELEEYSSNLLSPSAACLHIHSLPIPMTQMKVCPASGGTGSVQGHGAWPAWPADKREVWVLQAFLN